MLRYMSQVTLMLDAIVAGDRRAADELLPLVYHELRRLAARKLAGEKPGQTLDPTGLVHEAYMKLVGKDDRPRWAGRNHFFAAAAEAMRRILVDRARRKSRTKRGGGMTQRELNVNLTAAPEAVEEVLAIDDALTRLATVDAQAAELVKLRYYAGLPIPEVAQLLDISPRSADRLWAYARAWLHEAITST